MKIIVWADNEQKAVLLSKNRNENVIIEFANDYFELSSYENADALFILHNDVNLNEFQSFTLQPVFIHSVLLTLRDLNLPGNISRINAWPTFLQRELWEVSTKDEAMVKNVLEAIGWKYLIVPDEPGFVAARIIAMIINEAYFAFGDNVSSKDQIDVAMRLGTNYPYGPFEWAAKIGVYNIYQLLKKLNETSNRYVVAPSMENELVNIK
ncbi:MAG: 3-hydroxyacyl-CoA dehydrogenase family protein [Ginsengibacter sp.]